jgi:SulP family sulfate permease
MISASLPSLNWPTFEASLFQTMIIDAMALGMLGCIDSMLTSVIADNLTRTEHKSNKELIGQGLGNIFSGLFGGLPGAGATMGTVVNIQSGAQTALSGIIRVVVLLVAVFGASSLISHIPLAILAAIAAKVGANILDWSFIKKAHRVSKHSTVIMYGVMLLTVFVDLIVAVGVGVFIANIITIAKLSDSQEGNIKATSVSDDQLPLSERDQELIEQGRGQILFFYLGGAMIFGVSKALARQRAAIPEHDIIVIDLSDVSMLDDTISLSMENLVKEAIDQGKQFYLVVQTEVAKNKLKHMGFNYLIKDEDFLPNRTAALEKACKRLEADSVVCV